MVRDESIMWWGLLLGIALVSFIVEASEGLWLARKARRDLGVLRTELHSGRHWDAFSGYLAGLARSPDASQGAMTEATGNAPFVRRHRTTTNVSD